MRWYAPGWIPEWEEAHGFEFVCSEGDDLRVIFDAMMAARLGECDGACGAVQADMFSN